VAHSRKGFAQRIMSTVHDLRSGKSRYRIDDLGPFTAINIPARQDKSGLSLAGYCLVRSYEAGYNSDDSGGILVCVFPDGNNEV
jgi:putative hemolysin